jgi:hypothetical protein
MKKPISLLFLAVCFFAFTGFGVLGVNGATTVVIEGEFERIWLVSSALTNHYQFRAVLRDCNYHFTIYPRGSEFKRGHEELAFDGEQMYRVLYYNQEPLQEWKPGNTAEITAWVTPPKVPELGPNFLPNVWFAFLGRCYLASEKSGFVDCQFINPEKEGCLRPAVINLSSSKDIVNEMCIMQPGFTETMKGERQPLPAPYDAGFTNAVYRTLETRKVGDREIPSLFQWTGYEPKPKGNSRDELRMVWVATGRVTNATVSGESVRFRPRLQGRAAILDDRLLAFTKGHNSPYFASEIYESGGKPFKAELASILGTERASEPKDTSVPMKRDTKLVLISLAFLGLCFAVYKFRGARNE